MSNLTTTIVPEIQHHHREATAAAGVAIKHAVAAGRLLIEAKAAMPHGTFADWVEAECGIGYRMARKYMLASKRLAVLPEANWPSTANLDKALAVVAETSRRREVLAPDWLPALGEATTTADGRGRSWLVWRVTSEHAAAIVRTDLKDGGCFTEGMPRGIRNDYLPDVLGMLGLPKPATAEWSPASVAECCAYSDALREVSHA